MTNYQIPALVFLCDFDQHSLKDIDEEVAVSLFLFMKLDKFLDSNKQNSVFGMSTGDGFYIVSTKVSVSIYREILGFAHRIISEAKANSIKI